jgi:hypothetical protein
MARDQFHTIFDCILASVNRLLRLSCVLAIVFNSIAGARAQEIFLLNCATNYFELGCRGQLAMSAGPPIAVGTVFFAFLPNSTAAGDYGDTLANNSCAFINRPLNSNEPNLLAWNIFVTVNNQTMVDPVYTAFLTCNASIDCVTYLCVQNNNIGGFIVQQNNGETFQEYAGSQSGGPALMQMKRRPDVGSR